MAATDDTPRRAYTLLPWRVTLVVVVALLAFSALAWRATIEQAGSMSSMVMGLGQIGIRVQGSMGAGLFLAMWVTMMTAMMLPTVAPMVLAQWLPALAGAILIVAGAYQFTGWKQRCLDKCQSPLAFIATHDFSGGLCSALRVGVIHGAFCLGCWVLAWPSVLALISR